MAPGPLAPDRPRLLEHRAGAGEASALLACGAGTLSILVTDAVGPRSRPATPEEWERLAAWLLASERMHPPAPGQVLSWRVHGPLVRAVLGVLR